jgi:hypothetical protein
MVGGIFLLIFSYFFFSSRFAITSIEVAREDFSVDSAAITADLNGFIGKNILFLPRSRIISKIQENFPEFESIDVGKILPNKIQIRLASYPIVANVRAYYILPKVEKSPFNDTKISEELQKAFQEAFTLDPNAKEPEPENEPIEQKGLVNSIGQIILDQEEKLELLTIKITGLTKPVGNREFIISTDQITYIDEAIKYFNNLFDMKVAEVTYLPIPRELHFYTSTNLNIWLAMERDYEKQLDKLASIYKSAALDTEAISYIDLRINEKVIYCPVGNSCSH